MGVFYSQIRRILGPSGRGLVTVGKEPGLIENGVCTDTGSLSAGTL